MKLKISLSELKVLKWIESKMGLQWFIVKETFDFVICYLVILYYDLDFVLN